MCDGWISNHVECVGIATRLRPPYLPSAMQNETWHVCVRKVYLPEQQARVWSLRYHLQEQEMFPDKKS